MCEHGTKTIAVFLPAVGDASWSLLPTLVSLLSGGTVQPENTYSCILKVTGHVRESQKRISINTRDKLHPGTSEISASLKIAVRTHFHVQTWH